MTFTAFIGRVHSTGDRVYITISERNDSKSVETTDHDLMDGTYRLSITGTIVDKDRVSINSTGQINMGLSANEIIHEPGLWSHRDIKSLFKIWDEYHLNDMSAACAHMNFDGMGKDYDSRRNVVCPQTGYRYGSAWLFKRIPDETKNEIKRLMSLPTGYVPDYVY